MKLPVVSGKEVVRALRRAGFELDHQRGSHMILRHVLPPHRRVTVPNHREIDRGTLKSILNQSGITIEEFIALL